MMSLSCSCSDDYEWYYEITEEDYVANCRGRCYGRGQPVIKLGDTVSHVIAYEMDEFGDEVNHRVEGRICENCRGLYDSFLDLGFCLIADMGFIRDALLEYQQEYVPERSKIKCTS
jgi:hypothetical protein